MVEVKGDDRDNAESKRKLKLGRQQALECGDNYRYFMVFNNVKLDGTHSIDEFIEILKEL